MERYFPIRIDLIDLAGTRYGFALVTEEAFTDTDIMAIAYERARRFNGTAQAYYHDDPERELPE